MSVPIVGQPPIASPHTKLDKAKRKHKDQMSNTKQTGITATATGMTPESRFVNYNIKTTNVLLVIEQE